MNHTKGGTMLLGGGGVTRGRHIDAVMRQTIEYKGGHTVGRGVGWRRDPREAHRHRDATDARIQDGAHYRGVGVTRGKHTYTMIQQLR